MGRWLVRGVSVVLFLALVAIGGVGVVLWKFGRDLPDAEQLAKYQPPVMTRVHAGDGRLLAEFAIEKRIFMPIEAVPDRVKNAFVAAEDQHFYTHKGVDYGSVIRAVLQNAANLGSNRRPVGASTITQQVAKNFLLTNEVSIQRKVKEALVAFRIEKTLSKERILELYLNEIYFGGGAYGVAVASLNYFNKPLNELSIAEAAYLAALPKAPNNYNPSQFNDRAKARRDWVIDRMREENFVTAQEATAAQAEPLVTRKRDPEEVTRADYFAEEVRRELFQKYGEQGLYRGGLSVRTTLEPRLQAIADKVLRAGLITYDRRHGWRGPLARETADSWKVKLANFQKPPGTPDWQLAMVLKNEDPQVAEIGFADGTWGKIPMAELAWAHRVEPEQGVGPAPKKSKDVLEIGDIILVEPVTASADGKVKYPAGTFGLRQVPDVSGGLIAMDPHTGRVLAMTGGWSYEASQFNRATQAMRQPGSSFKPYVYMAALDNGFTPATLVLDAPFVIDQGGTLGKWKPANFGEKYFGPTPLRVGIEQSRNLMTVRLAEQVGMDKVATYAEKFGVVDRLPRLISMALGSAETTLLRQATGYSMIVNGGKKIVPTFIDRIQDREGKVVFRHDQRDCAACNPGEYNNQPPPRLPDNREQIEDPATAYQMTSILQGVVDRGSGSAVSVLRRPLAGKTGTTNDFTDAWFVGFSPDLTVAIYVGFDQPRTLGRNETGGRISAPIFRDFMGEALAKVPAVPFRIPPGVKIVRINAETGKLAGAGDRKTIYEAFKPGTEPGADDDDGNSGVAASPGGLSGGNAGGSTAGVGGLY